MRVLPRCRRRRTHNRTIVINNAGVTHCGSVLAEGCSSGRARAGDSSRNDLERTNLTARCSVYSPVSLEKIGITINKIFKNSRTAGNDLEPVEQKRFDPCTRVAVRRKKAYCTVQCTRRRRRSRRVRSRVCAFIRRVCCSIFDLGRVAFGRVSSLADPTPGRNRARPTGPRPRGA